MEASDVYTPLLVRPERAAELLSCSRAHLYSMVASGALPAVRLGHRGLRIPMDALRAWIEARTRGGVVDTRTMAKD